MMPAMRMHTLVVMLLVAVGCGGSSGANKDESLRRLSDAIQAPVSSPDEAQQNSNLTETVVEEGFLEDMTREEVSQVIGRGDDCSRHPRCAENGFEGDDWFYTVGQSAGAGNLPILIVGFDRSGRVERVWNFRTH